MFRSKSKAEEGDRRRSNREIEGHGLQDSLGWQMPKEPSSPHREPEQQCHSDDAERDMLAKHQAIIAKMEAECNESIRRCLEEGRKKDQQSTEEFEKQLSERRNQHEQEMKKKELIKKQESEEFEAWQRKSNLAAQEFEAKEKAQKELLSLKRREAEEEDMRLQAELEEKSEREVMLDMMDCNEKRIQTCMAIEENIKKAEEDVKSYIKATKEKTHNEVEKIKEELRYELFK